MNLDRVYDVQHIVSPGETAAAKGFKVQCGGKGLNQSIALARAEMKVLHVGAVGNDGEILIERLKREGVEVTGICRLKEPSGHAVIQVDENGQNAILVHGGANQLIEQEKVEKAIEEREQGDYLLLQNETSLIAFAMEKAHAKGLKIFFNFSPVTETIYDYPLHLVNCFLVNETEGKSLSGCCSNDPYEVLESFSKKYPQASIVLTVGEKGAFFRKGAGKIIYSPGFPVKAVDTTAAGDTFCGYFLAGLLKEMSVEHALRLANMAGAMAVEKEGAADSIPVYAEVQRRIVYWNAKS